MKGEEATGLKMCIFYEGKYQSVTLDIVEEIRDTSILFSQHKEIEVDAATLNYVREIVKDNEYALFVINNEKRKIVLDYEIPETQLMEELEGATNNV